ncbi:hypothetical protein Q73_06955 [Bacillus coahuilensis m2-6]|uniref:DUF3900 domain-containing protein n=1 Tax=Bacillus coahuilensis TaxID=408580 RepID=UPI0007503A92|nr:DUF3900 domain-containing protein [Bacillus coahuilensis]KUP08248.1 hypothetical protein Q73_06955 [Bacillus coahuilensis m2-6]
MDFTINFASFFVISVDGKGENCQKNISTFKHITVNMRIVHKNFLMGKVKIVKRKVERHPKNEQVPTKLGYFAVEPEYNLDSNSNFNMFQNSRQSISKEEFLENALTFVQAYIDASAVRGGAFIVLTATPKKYFDESFVFILKCDFEPKVASISDEASIIKHVEMAITTKNMKSIQYPYMPEEGIIEVSEVKIHQASHARYFEDFLKYVEYGEPMPTIVKNQLLEMVYEHVSETTEENSEERIQFEKDLEVWETISEERTIQEKLSTEQVKEASNRLVEQTPDLEINLTIGQSKIKSLLSEFGETLHIGKINNRYVLLIDSDQIQFEKGYSPIEFHRPDQLQSIVEKITENAFKDE